MGADSRPDGTSPPNPIPKAQKGDLEDVSWALSTAEASWQRGDRAESLKWLRRAAEAATEGSANARALFLAKAAADLTSTLARASSAGAPRPGAGQAPPPQRPADAPAKRQGPPALPTSTSASSRPTSPPTAPRPAGVHAAILSPRVPGASAGAPSALRAHEAKKTRRSSQNLEIDARAIKAAVAAPPAPRPAAPPTAAVDPRRKRPPAPPPDPDLPTEPGHRSAAITPRAPSVTDEIDAWPTETMVGSTLTDLAGDMAKTSPMAPPPAEPAKVAAPPRALGSSPVVGRSGSVRPPAPPRPGAASGASQAVRVLVWQTPDGLRVAPVGTPVSATAVEAMLVALDPAADLAAWFVR